MKTLLKLYEEIEKEDIDILEVKFNKKKAGIISIDHDVTIIIDYSKIEDEKEEKIIIAEEKAHYDTGSFYSLNASHELMDKMEYKARKRVYNELIPYNVLKELSQRLTIDELSEYFGVPVKDIIMASFLYTNIENFTTT